MTTSTRKGGRLAAVALWAGASLAPAPAFAGSFQVNPVNIALSPDRAATELRLSNSDPAPVAVRVKAFRWTQKDGKDVAEPTSDIIASPPIFTVAPGGTQLIRLGLRKRIPGAAYRLHVEEIPSPGESTGIRVALKLDLPFYVLDKAAKAPALRWTARRDPALGLVVEGHNGGGRHDQVTGLELRDAAGKTIAASSAMGVVLPASSRTWVLKAGGKTAAAGVPAELIVKRVGGETRSRIDVERP